MLPPPSALGNVLEEYVCKLYQLDAHVLDSLSDGGGCFRIKSLKLHSL